MDEYNFLERWIIHNADIIENFGTVMLIVGIMLAAAAAGLIVMIVQGLTFRRLPSHRRRSAFARAYGDFRPESVPDDPAPMRVTNTHVRRTRALGAESAPRRDTIYEDREDVRGHHRDAGGVHGELIEWGFEEEKQWAIEEPRKK